MDSSDEEAARSEARPPLREEDLLFNVVYVPGSFRYLGPFLDSMLRHSRVRARIVANGYDDDDLRAMRATQGRFEGRVEVLPFSRDVRVEHAAVLNALAEVDADLEHFCFLDSDVLARGPWTAPFLEVMRSAVAVSSAHPSWDPDPRPPVQELGLRGHYVYGADGTLFGTSYLAIYRRRALDEVRGRWDVDFRLANHHELAPATRARMEELDRHYLYYDTAKTINALLQLDGHRVAYVDDAPLVHIGSMSILDFMVNTPPELWPDPFGVDQVDDKLARDTIEVAAAVAGRLIELVDGRGPARLPAVTDERLVAWLRDFDPTLVEVVERARHPVPAPR